MAKKQNQTFKVANTLITLGDTIEIVSKKDLDAPSGFQAFNTTKLLMDGIKEIRSVYYDEDLRMYDTGFDVHSPCNNSIPKEEKTALIKVYNELVRKPYEEAYRVDVDAVSEDFWGGNDSKKIKPFSLEIYTGRTFDTNKPNELFELFHILKQGFACEVGEKDPTLQRRANYCIKNNKKVQSLQEEKSEQKFEAMTTFKIMLDAFDPKKDDTLYTILEWIQLANIRGADKDTLKRTVIKLFDNEKFGYDNAKRFLEAYTMTQTELGKKEMEMFSMITKLYNKHKIEFKRQQYYLDGMLLGNHLKEAAKVATSNPETKKMIEEAYEKIA